MTEQLMPAVVTQARGRRFQVQAGPGTVKGVRRPLAVHVQDFTGGTGHVLEVTDPFAEELALDAAVASLIDEARAALPPEQAAAAAAPARAMSMDDVVAALKAAGLVIMPAAQTPAESPAPAPAPTPPAPPAAAPDWLQQPPQA